MLGTAAAIYLIEGLIALLDDLLHGERRRGESDEVREIIQICPHSQHVLCSKLVRRIPDTQPSFRYAEATELTRYNCIGHRPVCLHLVSGDLISELSLICPSNSRYRYPS